MTKSEALEASIIHWQENVKAETPQEARVWSNGCALCQLYLHSADCEGCPVMDAGAWRCVGTPYEAARDALIIWRYHTSASDKTAWLAARDEFSQRAQAEVNFLISLRETG